MPHRILTNPVRLTGSVHPQQLAAFVAIDSLVRHCAMSNVGELPIWEVSSLAGDVAVQRATQEQLDVEGEDARELEPEQLNARARLLEDKAERNLQTLFDELGIKADLDQWSASSEAVARTARIAFVRLYETGLLRLTDAVLDACPTCETVIDAAEADEIEIDTDVYRVSLFLSDDASLLVNLLNPELLVGAVAVAVPASMSLADTEIFIPVRDQRVPIVAINDLDQPVLVVPGHDSWSYELAKQLGLPFEQVLDGEGIVRHPGSLEGLGRETARAVAVSQLQAEGRIALHGEGRALIRSCHRCHSELVPLLGRHWLLPMADLVAPVVESVRAGSIAFSPPFVVEAFLEATERTGDWAISQQLWSGVQIPVARCLDCGQIQVSVDVQESCGACMGTLQYDTDVIDGRFVAAITPLAMLGWPQNVTASTLTTLLVGIIGLEAWAIPVAALGLALAGLLPYQQVIIQQEVGEATELGQMPTREMSDHTRRHGPDVVRAALLSGSLDVAAHQIATLNEPPLGDHAIDGLAEPVDKSIRSLDAGQALAIVAGALREGISISDVEAARRLVAPVLGRSGF